MVEEGNLHLSKERKDGTGGKWEKEQVEARVETVMDEKQKQAERGERAVWEEPCTSLHSQ